MDISTVAIITGASRGLGHALALGLLQPGAQLITIARSHDAALEQQAASAGCLLQQVQADLSDPAAAGACAAKVMASLPQGAQRYLLINNAGTVAPIKQAADLTDANAIAAAFNLNVTSLIALSSAFLHATQGATDRRILNISSGAGRNPMPGWGVYCATKAAVDLYSQVVHAENHGVRIVSLAPGVIDTGMQKQIRSSDAASFPNVERFAQMHEEGQLATPAAVAQKILHYIAHDSFGSTVLDDIRNHA
ncbi:SDR family oxidoreductase [Alcaligenaceae bacterium]|nr:SDR family oxidoreductase [Alcaligenaceae bacterium]